MSLYSSSDRRKEYRRQRLRKADVDPDPLTMFTIWLDEAMASGIQEPNAMTLATAGADGRPSARMVLLKGFDIHGFRFYTNYTSRKARDLEANPWAALTFWWDNLERQVRIEGRVAKLTSTESDAYYLSRPLGSRLGAWVSEQSSVITGRDVLEERLAEIQARYAQDPPSRPEAWGGYRVVPTAYEFWQGGEHRLHDRLCYTRNRSAVGWQIERLAP